MEIVAGKRACYNLLAFICLKMELHWRNYRVFVKLLNVLLTFSSHLYSKKDRNLVFCCSGWECIIIAIFPSTIGKKDKS